MKKVAILILAIAGFVACDKVENPNQKTGTTVIGTTFITKTNSLVVNSRKVLVEDYTGHKCGNCPPAATEAENLENQHKDSVIIIAVHAGGFAYTTPAPTYTTDFQTSAGTAWYTFFGFATAGNPNGLVNRRDFLASTHVKAYTTWNGFVTPYLVLAQDARMEVTTNYDPIVKALNVSVKTKFKKAFPNDVSLQVVLTEDSIIDYQKDYSKIPVDVYPYVFMNILRGSINSDWGSTIKTAPIAINDSVSTSYSNFAVSSTFNDKRLSVVAFTYDNITKEVIQVEKVKIR